MALQVWLPLNGDLKNHGVGTITNASGNPTFVKSITGKGIDTTKEIYSFKCNELEDCDSFTIAFWVKVNTDSTLSSDWLNVLTLVDQNVDKSVTGTIRFEANYGSSTKGLYVNNNYAFNTLDDYGLFYTGYDTWHHVALIIDNENNTKALYTDGVEVSKVTRIGTSNVSSTGFYPGTGTLTGHISIGERHPNAIVSDLRIYDTAISPKEIKEISKGLICHYTLNNPNMTASSEPVEADVSGFDNHLDYNKGQPGAVYSTTLSSPKYSGYYDYSSNSSYLISTKPAIDFLPTESVTMSMWIYLPDLSKKDTNYQFFECFESGGIGLETTDSCDKFDFSIFCKSANAYKYASYTPSFSNKWTLLTGTYDGKSLCIYENAVLKSSTAVTDSISYNSVVPLVLNGNPQINKAITTNQKIQISDARIYCTALSQSDILALYQERESVANNGSILAGELKEDSSATKANFTSTGIISYVNNDEDHFFPEDIVLTYPDTTNNFSVIQNSGYIAKLSIAAATTTETGIWLHEKTVPSGYYLEVTVEFLQTSAVHFEMGLYNQLEGDTASSIYSPVYFINRTYTTGSSVSSNTNIWNVLKYRVYNSDTDDETFIPYIYFTAYDLKSTTSDTTFYLRHLKYRISKVYNTFGANVPARIVSSTKTVLTNNEFIEN